MPPWSLLFNPTMAADTFLRMFPNSSWEENIVSLFRTTNIYLECLSCTVPLKLHEWERDYRISFSGMHPNLNHLPVVSNVLSLSWLSMPRARILQMPQLHSLFSCRKVHEARKEKGYNLKPRIHQLLYQNVISCPVTLNVSFYSVSVCSAVLRWVS